MLTNPQWLRKRVALKYLRVKTYRRYSRRKSETLISRRVLYTTPRQLCLSLWTRHGEKLLQSYIWRFSCIRVFVYYTWRLRFRNQNNIYIYIGTYAHIRTRFCIVTVDLWFGWWHSRSEEGCAQANGGDRGIHWKKKPYCVRRWAVFVRPVSLLPAGRPLCGATKQPARGQQNSPPPR